MTTEDILQERNKTHGSFVQNATVSQKLKAVVAEHAAPIESPVFRESLDMIFLKISRIASGQAHFKDHWDDIAGYAKLASAACAEPAEAS